MEQKDAPKKVLIIEDEAPMLRALIDVFTNAKFDVLEARNGASGLSLALQHKPDIIILDLVLPVMDGLTMLQKLRADEPFGKEVPVIVLTNLSADNDTINAAVATYNPAYYLVKTEWTIRDVMEKVKERLGISN